MIPFRVRVFSQNNMTGNNVSIILQLVLLRGKRNFKGKKVSFEAKILKGKYKAKPEFRVEWGFKLRSPLWEGP